MNVITPKRTLIIPSRVARSARESEHPWCWNGLVGLWTPMRPHSKAIDYSPGRNHGTYNGGMASAVSDPQRGLVWNFDGTDDYVDCGNIAGLNVGTGDFTVSLWARTTTTPSFDGVIGNAYDDGGGYDGFTITLNSATSIRMRTYVNGALTQSTGTIADITDGAWHFILIRRASGTQYLYYDNSQIDSDASSRDITTAGSLHIGRNNVQGNCAMLIQDVRAYNRALTPWEIKAIYEGANPLTPRRRYWSLPLSFLAAPPPSTRRVMVIS